MQPSVNPLERFQGVVQLKGSFLTVEAEDPTLPGLELIKCSLSPLKLEVDPSLYPPRKPTDYTYEWLVYSGPRTFVKMIRARISEMISYKDRRLFSYLSMLRAELVNSEDCPFDFMFITGDNRFDYYGLNGHFYNVSDLISSMTIWGKHEENPIDRKWYPKEISGSYKCYVTDLLKALHSHPVTVTQHTPTTRVVLPNPFGGNQDDHLVSTTEGTPPASKEETAV